MNQPFTVQPSHYSLLRRECGPGIVLHPSRCLPRHKPSQHAKCLKRLMFELLPPQAFAVCVSRIKHAATPVNVIAGYSESMVDLTCGHVTMGLCGWTPLPLLLASARIQRVARAVLPSLSAFRSAGPSRIVHRQGPPALRLVTLTARVRHAGDFIPPSGQCSLGLAWDCATLRCWPLPSRLPPCATTLLGAGRSYR